MSEAEYGDEIYRYEIEETWRIALRRLRPLERLFGLPHLKVVFDPKRMIYDGKGNRLEAHIPKPGERFYEKIREDFKPIDRELNTIYIYCGEPSMELIECVIHECVERLEDIRDKPSVEGVNRFINHLNDLTEEILKRKNSPSDLVEIAIAKSDQVKKDASRVSEEIYRERERVVDILASYLTWMPSRMFDDEYERGRQLFREVYLREGPARRWKLTEREKELLAQYMEQGMIEAQKTSLPEVPDWNRYPLFTGAKQHSNSIDICYTCWLTPNNRCQEMLQAGAIRMEPLNGETLCQLCGKEPAGCRVILQDG